MQRDRACYPTRQAETAYCSFRTQEFAAASKSTLQGGCLLRRRQQCLCKALLISHRQADDLGLLDGTLRGVLDGSNHEVGHSAPLKLSGALEHRMQVGADSGFETGGRNGCRHGYILHRENVRQFAGLVKWFEWMHTSKFRITHSAVE